MVAGNVRDGLSALYIERVVGRMSARVLSGTGRRLPLHARLIESVLPLGGRVAGRRWLRQLSLRS